MVEYYVEDEVQCQCVQGGVVVGCVQGGGVLSQVGDEKLGIVQQQVDGYEVVQVVGVYGVVCDVEGDELGGQVVQGQFVQYVVQCWQWG